MCLTTQNERIAVLQISLRNLTVWYAFLWESCEMFHQGLALLLETDSIAQKIATDTQAPIKMARGPPCHFDRHLSEHGILFIFLPLHNFYTYLEDRKSVV